MEEYERCMQACYSMCTNKKAGACCCQSAYPCRYMGQPHMARHAGWFNAGKLACLLTCFHSNAVPALSTCSQWLRKHLLPLTSQSICREICLTNQRDITSVHFCLPPWWQHSVHVVMFFSKWVKTLTFCLLFSFVFFIWVSLSLLTFKFLSFSIFEAGILFSCSLWR